MRWFDYVERVHQECRNLINEDCSKRAHTKLKLDWEKTYQCVKDSFSQSTGWQKSTVTNTLID